MPRRRKKKRKQAKPVISKKRQNRIELTRWLQRHKPDAEFLSGERPFWATN